MLQFIKDSTEDDHLEGEGEEKDHEEFKRTITTDTGIGKKKRRKNDHL